VKGKEEMGASGWSYFVPYEPSIETALQKLRKRVFAEKRYFVRSVAETIKALENYIARMEKQPADWSFFDKTAAEYQADAKAQIAQLKLLPVDYPSTIDELLEFAGENGTHSILDILESGLSRELFKAGPLDEEELISVFATAKPSHSIVQDKILVLQQLRQRWMASYVLIYEDDQPVEILFVGFSGD